MILRRRPWCDAKVSQSSRKYWHFIYFTSFHLLPFWGFSNSFVRDKKQMLFQILWAGISFKTHKHNLVREQIRCRFKFFESGRWSFYCVMHGHLFASTIIILSQENQLDQWRSSHLGVCVWGGGEEHFFGVPCIFLHSVLAWLPWLRLFLPPPPTPLKTTVYNKFMILPTNTVFRCPPLATPLNYMLFYSFFKMADEDCIM